MNVVLIGYRGTGKSAVARLLAERLDCAWIDADVELERRAGRTIADIFARQGEPAFRDLEAEVLADLLRGDNLVVAAGGGCVLRPENRAALRAAFVVWLQADADTIEQRLAGDATTAARRPNLTAAGGREEIVGLLAAREPYYRQCAQGQVDTSGKSPVQVADEVATLLRNRPGRSERA